MNKGFTLIELLIVVAIIAILAAIAVPNFLEAQTRSKVARVKADMRSLATALETYALDYNNYPLGKNAAIALGLTGDDAHLFGLSKLTTPVAHMSTLPKDPFMLISGTSDGKRRNFPPLFQTFGSEQWGLSEATYGSQISYGYKAAKYGYNWVLYSQGPSGVVITGRIWQIMISYKSGDLLKSGLYVYDATNGTVSQGYIMRSNIGDFPD